MANEEHFTRLKQGFVNVLARARHALASGTAYVYAWRETWIAEWQVEEAIRRTPQRIMARLRSTSWQEIARQYLPLLVGLGVLLLLFALWKLPQWYAASWDKLTDPKDIAKLESDTRTTLVQAVGGLVLLVGIFFTAKTLRTTQEGQITDRFTKAINQLGEIGTEKLAIRLGGIYALERIARDSERDHWPIMEILTAYVREHAPWPPKDIPPLADDLSPTEKSPEGKDQPQLKPALDIQAILTVLGRRTRYFSKGEDQRLNLADTDLRGATLQAAHLEGAKLDGAHLEGADLTEAHLEGARLTDAHLEGAKLDGAHLEGADLTEAHLEGARLTDAHLEGASLLGTYLERVILSDAHLEKAVMEGAHLEGAYLRHAHLEDAVMWVAHLEGANLTDAHLEGASLWDAHLEKAVMRGAHLEGTWLIETHLKGAIGLTIKQLSTVKTLWEAELDLSLLEQIQQQYPHLREELQD